MILMDVLHFGVFYSGLVHIHSHVFVRLVIINWIHWSIPRFGHHKLASLDNTKVYDFP